MAITEIEQGVSWDGGNELCGRWWCGRIRRHHDWIRFGISNCAPRDTPVAKVGSLMYAQVCTHSDIAYIVGMLGRYLSNPAYYETSNHGIWLWNFITELHIVDGIEKPLRINYDNKAAELYSKNNRSSSKSKHIDFKFLVVKEKVQSLQVSIEHISTNS
ncbi:hypothetical protein CK203_099174 [Vitis vinifera]|uniref:Retrovirus-related Pol polyprotein from transposon TNT 1-94 n=1 Tax=Vitis vinifera TaxID=29760 RepID=A0A438BT12_VITVI|nr:hypothetical protein CK203_099174 [Vitis vinifera]